MMRTEDPAQTGSMKLAPNRCSTPRIRLPCAKAGSHGPPMSRAVAPQALGDLGVGLGLVKAVAGRDHHKQVARLRMAAKLRHFGLGVVRLVRQAEGGLQPGQPLGPVVVQHGMRDGGRARPYLGGP